MGVVVLNTDPAVLFEAICLIYSPSCRIRVVLFPHMLKDVYVYQMFMKYFLLKDSP